MSDTLEDASAEAVLARLELALDDLRALTQGPLADDDVLKLWRRQERVSRRLAAADHAVIAQVESRHLPYEHACRSTVAFARQVLRIGPREAKGRIEGAHAAAPRTSLLGEALPPIFEHVAEAQRCGDISPAHARIVVETVEALPGHVQHELGSSIEASLVREARALDPDTLAKLAAVLRAQYDDDGRDNDPQERERRRGVTVSFRTDGSCRGTFEGTPEFAEYLRTTFDALARPVQTDGCPDLRNPGQRRHDALEQALAGFMRLGGLPAAGGITSTIILTTSAENWAAGTGTTTTGHGAVLPTSAAKAMVSGDSRVITLALDRMMRIQAYSCTQRLFTEQQRLVIIARDGGCIFPGCDAPPQHCEAHHVDEWQHSKRTSVDNGVLLCRFHHRHHAVLGWRIEMIDGVPWWIPPRFIDPDRRPVRNRMHHPTQDLLPV